MTPPRGRILLAFASIYLVWGSTYLFMRFAVETLPPIALAGVRYLLAGAILYGIARWRAVPEPHRIPWRGHAIVGTLLTVGNGSVALAVQRIPSGVAALLVAMTPCLMVLLEWWWRRGSRPAAGVVVGLVLGVGGVMVLVGPQSFGGAPVDRLGAGIVLFGSAAWATGSIYSRGLPRYESSVRPACDALGWRDRLSHRPGWRRLRALDPGTASFRSVFAGVPYSRRVAARLLAYMYLLGVTTAALPLCLRSPWSRSYWVRCSLGTALPSLLGAGAIIVVAVATITLYGGERRLPPQRRRAGEDLEVHEAP